MTSDTSAIPAPNSARVIAPAPPPPPPPAPAHPDPSLSTSAPASALPPVTSTDASSYTTASFASFTTSPTESASAPTESPSPAPPSPSPATTSAPAPVPNPRIPTITTPLRTPPPSLPPPKWTVSVYNLSSDTVHIEHPNTLGTSSTTGLPLETRRFRRFRTVHVTRAMHDIAMGRSRGAHAFLFRRAVGAHFLTLCRHKRCFLRDAPPSSAMRGPLPTPSVTAVLRPPPTPTPPASPALLQTAANALRAAERSLPPSLLADLHLGFTRVFTLDDPALASLPLVRDVVPSAATTFPLTATPHDTRRPVLSIAVSYRPVATAAASVLAIPTVAWPPLVTVVRALCRRLGFSTFRLWSDRVLAARKPPAPLRGTAARVFPFLLFPTLIVTPTAAPEDARRLWGAVEQLAAGFGHGIIHPGAPLPNDRVPRLWVGPHVPISRKNCMPAKEEDDIQSKYDQRGLGNSRASRPTTPLSYPVGGNLAGNYCGPRTVEDSERANDGSHTAVNTPTAPTDDESLRAVESSPATGSSLHANEGSFLVTDGGRTFRVTDGSFRATDGSFRATTESSVGYTDSTFRGANVSSVPATDGSLFVEDDTEVESEDETEDDDIPLTWVGGLQHDLHSAIRHLVAAIMCGFLRDKVVRWPNDAQELLEFASTITSSVVYRDLAHVFSCEDCSRPLGYTSHDRVMTILSSATAITPGSPDAFAIARAYPMVDVPAIRVCMDGRTWDGFREWVPESCLWGSHSDERVETRRSVFDNTKAILVSDGTCKALGILQFAIADSTPDRLLVAYLLVGLSTEPRNRNMGVAEWSKRFWPAAPMQLWGHFETVYQDTGNRDALSALALLVGAASGLDYTDISCATEVCTVNLRKVRW